MPLPFAPPPKESKVYTDLKNLKITGVTAEQMDTLKGQLFAQGIDGSEDEMRRLKLLGEVSNQQSSSGSIPGTAEVIRLQRTSAGVNTIFAPSEGEAWVIDGAQSGSFYTGQTTVTLSLYDPNNTYMVSVGQQDAADTAFTASYMSSPVHIVYPLSLRASFGGTASGGTGIVFLAIHRVR